MCPTDLPAWPGWGNVKERKKHTDRTRPGVEGQTHAHTHTNMHAWAHTRMRSAVHPCTHSLTRRERESEISSGPHTRIRKRKRKRKGKGGGEGDSEDTSGVCCELGWCMKQKRGEGEVCAGEFMYLSVTFHRHVQALPTDEVLSNPHHLRQQHKQEHHPGSSSVIPHTRTYNTHAQIHRHTHTPQHTSHHNMHTCTETHMYT